MVAIGEEEPMKSEKILVLVRLRPLSEKERENNEILDWECINEKTIVFQNNPQERSLTPMTHSFDRVFKGECSTRQVYEEGAKEIALSVVSGINSSILAYGQTSSGKTYTMSGITEYAVADIYDYIIKHEERAFVIKFSAMEIYNEAVGDLLSTDYTPLRVRDDPEKGAFVENLTEEILRDWGHLKELLSICKAQRRIGETSLNETSSRSHQIVRLTIESSAREFLGKENSAALSATLNFVDLAGSERTSQTSASGERLKEGCHINSSLFTLGNVIRKLSRGRQGHVSYRDSKLTRILQPCLGGNARTAMICTLSSARAHAEQSRNTLFFASYAKEVSTNAKVNIVMSDKALLKRLQSEVARLESELRVPLSSLSCDCAKFLKEKDHRIEKLEMEVRELTEQRDLAESRVKELQIIIESYQTSREPAKRDNSYRWKNGGGEVRYSETDESSKEKTSESITISTGDDEATSTLMVLSYGNEAFESSCPRKEDSTTIEDSQQDYQSSRDLGDQCIEVQNVETDEFSEDEVSTLMEHNYGNEAFESSSSDEEEEESANARFRKQWDLAGFQGERESSAQWPDFVVTDESSDNEVSNSVAFSTGDGDGTKTLTIRSYANSRKEKASITRLRNQSLSRSSKFRLSKDIMGDSPSLSSQMSRQIQNPGRGVTRNTSGRIPVLSQNPRLPPRPGAGVATLSTELTFSPLASSFLDEVNSGDDMSAAEEDIPSVRNFVAGLKEMAKLDYENNSAKSQVQGTPKSTEAPNTSWAVIFVMLQKSILELWQICNISLVHRTYFFLLFKGDPTDSIYMEIELRRLSFLGEAFSKDNHAMDGNQTLTLQSSVEALRQERDMLIRLMHKKYSRSEREKLYEKWAIKLDSKQRKRQFLNLLWSDTNDLRRILESAEIVAKLIGFSDHGASLKEMFGLSFGFSVMRRSRRSFLWN